MKLMRTTPQGIARRFESPSQPAFEIEAQIAQH